MLSVLFIAVPTAFFLNLHLRKFTKGLAKHKKHVKLKLGANKNGI